ESKKKSRTRIFLEQFNDILIFILFGAVVISLILSFVESSKYASLSIEHFVDSIVIIIVLLLNAIIGFYQEIKAEKEVSALKSLIKTESIVIRNNNKSIVFQEELVQGDIIDFESGQKIPADARIIESSNLQVIESSLTGESNPVNRIL
ncbi:MAG: HAD-IC family P-type ATPase, partial [Candidatus Hodarchaeales archaeon]